MNPEAILNLSKVNRNANKFNALQALLLIMKTSKLHINFIVLHFSLFELYYWCVTTVLSTKPKALFCLQNLLHKFDRSFADGSKLFLPAPKIIKHASSFKIPNSLVPDRLSFVPGRGHFSMLEESMGLLNTIAQQHLHINKIKKNVQIVTCSKMEQFYARSARSTWLVTETIRNWFGFTNTFYRTVND